jgi:hypothetical protein
MAWVDMGWIKNSPGTLKNAPEMRHFHFKIAIKYRLIQVDAENFT